MKLSPFLLCTVMLVAGTAAAQTLGSSDDASPSSGTLTLNGSGPDTGSAVTLGNGTLGDDSIVEVTTTGSGGETATNGTANDGPLPNGPFARLSPGNQKIAKSLFDAQSAQTATGAGDGGTTASTADGSGGANWTLDEIAVAKQGTGWGRLFKDMQDAGAIPDDVKNLGELVSGRYRPSDGTSENPTVTLGDGTTNGDEGAAELTDMDHGGDTTTRGDAPAPDGPYARLSPGNQKIAKSLFDAQSTQTATGTGGGTTASTADGSGGANWTLDEIAVAKQGTGWGPLFKDMQDAGAIPDDVKNLGELVSGRYRPHDTGSETSGVTAGEVGDGISADGTTAVHPADRISHPTVTKAKSSTGSGATSVGRTQKGGASSDLVITTGNGRQVYIGGSDKGTKAAGVSDRRGGKGNAVGGPRRYTDTTVVTTGSGAQAAIGAGRGKGLTGGAGRSLGGGHGKGGRMHTGKGSGKVAVTTGRGRSKGMAHGRGGGKGKGKIK